MCEGYELPGAAGAAEAGGGGGGAEAGGEGLTPAALMESNVTSLKAGMSSGLQEKTYVFIPFTRPSFRDQNSDAYFSTVMQITAPMLTSLVPSGTRIFAR